MEIVSFVEHLEQLLQSIENQVIEMLDASTIEKRYQDPFSEVVFIANDYYWGKTNEKQKHVQLKLLRSYLSWFEHFQLLFHDSPKDIQKQITDTHTAVKKWIEKTNGWNVPPTIEEAKRIFREQLQTYYSLLQVFKRSDKAEIILVPDTNALIMCPDIASYAAAIGQADYTVVILPTVLSELDNLKIVHRNDDFRDYSPRLKPWASRGKPTLCNPTALMFKAALRSRSLERRQQGQ